MYFSLVISVAVYIRIKKYDVIFFLAGSSHYEGTAVFPGINN